MATDPLPTPPPDGEQARVALELAQFIGNQDADPKGIAQRKEGQGRQYWLGLYAECLRAVRGETPAK